MLQLLNVITPQWQCTASFASARKTDAIAFH